jgi:cytoskeletal protein RodZ
METTYFVLGMLSVVALIFIGVITWGMFKISKQQSEIENLNEQITSVMRTISSEMDYTSRRIENERREIYDEIINRNNDVQRQFEDVYRQLKDVEDNSGRYTDKRIDKLIDTYFDIKKNKDLLKG